MIIQWNTETDKEKETIIRNLGESESESRKEKMRTKKKSKQKSRRKPTRARLNFDTSA